MSIAFREDQECNNMSIGFREDQEECDLFPCMYSLGCRGRDVRFLRRSGTCFFPHVLVGM